MDQQTSPPVDNTVGPKSLAIITPILALGILFYSVRIYTRVVPTYKLNASDYTSTVAVLACAITYALFATAVGHGFGRHSYYITPENGTKILQCLYGVTLSGLCASVFARISIACLLLQFATTTTWKAILWAAIIFQIASLIANEAFELAQCHPIRTFWEKVPGGHCFSPSTLWSLSYLFIGIGMVGDIICILMPMFLIWRLTRSVVERCLISFLMALSLFAAGAGVLKIIYQKRFDRTSPDPFRAMTQAFLWCRMEEVLLTVASSAPLIKTPVVHALHRLGLPMLKQKTMDLNSFHSSRLQATANWYNPQSRQETEDRPAGRQGMMTDEGKLEAGEYSSSAASALETTQQGTLYLAHSEDSDDGNNKNGASSVKSANGKNGGSTWSH